MTICPDTDILRKILTQPNKKYRINAWMDFWNITNDIFNIQIYVLSNSIYWNPIISRLFRLKFYILKCLLHEEKWIHFKVFRTFAKHIFRIYKRRKNKLVSILLRKHFEFIIPYVDFRWIDEKWNIFCKTFCVVYTSKYFDCAIRLCVLSNI